MGLLGFGLFGFTGLFLMRKAREGIIGAKGDMVTVIPAKAGIS